MLPSFLIMGERKCGTSSLFRHLITHPQVLPGRLKEPNFFGSHPPDQLSAHWEAYLANFPRIGGAGRVVLTWPELDEEGQLYEEEVVFEKNTQQRLITGEASANTMYEVDPQVVWSFLPQLRLVAVLRDPVERAFSHHRMYQRFQAEGRELGFEVGTFEADMRRELSAWPRPEACPCLGPGVYLPRLQRWAEVFGRDALLVLLSQELDQPARAQLALDRVGQHLGLETHHYGAQLQQRYNVAPPAQMTPEVRRQLQAFYAPYNRALAEWLGKHPGWQC